jgi:hypothetical protein
MNILHLSDLHFGTLTDATIWYSQLAYDLKAELGVTALDALILSGDIAAKSTSSEYMAAAQFLRDLCKEFALTPIQVIIVPGNHDLSWPRSREAYARVRLVDYRGVRDEKGSPDQHCAIDEGEFVEVLNSTKYKRRFNGFRRFYKAVKGEPYPVHYGQQGTVHHLAAHNLLILGLNSAWEVDHHYVGRASICPDALSHALDEIREHPEVYGNCLNMAVWHHPLRSSEDDYIRDDSFMQRLAQAGFSVALHGHIHKAQTSTYCYDMIASGRRLQVISAGTFGAPTREWVPGYPLEYNLLRLEGDRLTVETRCRREPNGAWQPDAIWLQGPGKDPLPRYHITVPAGSAGGEQPTPPVPLQVSPLRPRLSLRFVNHRGPGSICNVYVSCRQVDLLPHRQVLRKALSVPGLVAVWPSEDDLSPDAAAEVDARSVRDCDYLFLVAGNEYSIEAAREYNLARRHARPVVAFVHDSSVRRQRRQAGFIRQMERSARPRRYSDAQDLASLARQALILAFLERVAEWKRLHQALHSLMTAFGEYEITLRSLSIDLQGRGAARTGGLPTRTERLELADTLDRVEALGLRPVLSQGRRLKHVARPLRSSADGWQGGPQALLRVVGEWYMQKATLQDISSTAGMLRDSSAEFAERCQSCLQELDLSLRDSVERLHKLAEHLRTI